ncbi:MAG: DUF480 domain-containing protein [Planctomycetota bacterium]|nr:DUF480 domain-containing protein [Planctomycetota bacterium]
MISLTPDECRVLGVLIEKELTTPEQYPLTLNGIINGSSQKNNREPVVQFDEGRAYEAAEGLRGKGLVVRVDTVGSRVPKFRQEAVQKLGLTRYELVLLAELLLRGPQTVGELRGRASRMHHLDSMEIVEEMLKKMMEREEALVKELPPSPGSRAERFMQLLCPEAHPVEAVVGVVSEAAVVGTSGRSMAERIGQLEAEVARLKEVVKKLSVSLGEGDPFAAGGGGEAGKA